MPKLLGNYVETELLPRPESGTVGFPALGRVRMTAGTTVRFGVFGEIIPRRFFMLFRSKIVTFNINYAETHQRLRLGDWGLSHAKMTFSAETSNDLESAAHRLPLAS